MLTGIHTGPRQFGITAEQISILLVNGSQGLSLLTDDVFGTFDQARVRTGWYLPRVDDGQRLSEIVRESLDQEQDAGDLARHACLSRTQFYRVFRAMVEETPVAMRRRLLLERAAWQLSRTQLSVTDIGLNANYGSLEAFTRAFRKAFGISPTLYRRMGATFHHLHAPNGIHHHSGTDDTKGIGRFMDLFDIFSGQESWHTRRLLDLAKTLNDAQLDRPLKNQLHVFPW